MMSLNLSQSFLLQLFNSANMNVFQYCTHSVQFTDRDIYCECTLRVGFTAQHISKHISKLYCHLLLLSLSIIYETGKSKLMTFFFENENIMIEVIFLVRIRLFWLPGTLTQLLCVQYQIQHFLCKSVYIFHDIWAFCLPK